MHFPSIRAALLAAFTLASVTQTTATATPVLWAEDTFSYSDGRLPGQSGGTGWSNNWYNTYYGNGLSISSGQLTFGSSHEIEASARTTDQRFSGSDFSKVFITFDVLFGRQSGSGTPNLRLQDSALGYPITGGLGNNGYSGTYGILGPDLSVGGNSSVSLNIGAFLLFEIDYTQTQSRLWIGNSAWDMTGLPTTGWDASFAFAPTFDTLNLFVRELNYFDNLRIHAIAIPEPATYASLFGMAALTAVFGLRRRRTPRA